MSENQMSENQGEQQSGATETKAEKAYVAFLAKYEGRIAELGLERSEIKNFVHLRNPKTKQSIYVGKGSREVGVITTTLPVEDMPGVTAVEPGSNGRVTGHIDPDAFELWLEQLAESDAALPAPRKKGSAAQATAG